MVIWELLLIAVGLSMDAFVVSAGAGLTMPKVTVKKCLIVGLYFGVFQAVMPLLGWLLATWLADRITTFDHWIAFGLLGFIGGRMIVGSFKKKGCADRDCPAVPCTDRSCPREESLNRAETSLKPGTMLPLAIATSIDALAIGVSFGALRVEIAPAVLLIGSVTLVLSMVGVKLGNLFGIRFKSKAELAGGIILILLGTKILLEHLGVINL